MSSPYDDLDEALVPLHQHLALMVPGALDARWSDESGRHGARFVPETVSIEMPIELDILPGEDGIALGSSPPLYYVSTGFGNARHNLRFSLVESSSLDLEHENLVTDDVVGLAPSPTEQESS